MASLGGGLYSPSASSYWAGVAFTVAFTAFSTTLVVFREYFSGSYISFGHFFAIVGAHCTGIWTFSQFILPCH